MRWISLLFDFRGRIGRATWWITGFIWAMVLTAAETYCPSIKPPELGKWLFVAVAVVTVISVVTLGVRRIHDRDRSGWLMLIFCFVPGLAYAVADSLFRPADDAGPAVALYAIGIAVGAWAFIELGLLPGTHGPNQYGSDPVIDHD